jgi:bifunctional UDP-N-acetylglucosamine pyrophosphorylase/glucosamine-1-phosphate N-acetyltransferase
MSLHLCILAAGQSTRMKSKTSKMLHPVCGKPMILHVLDAAGELDPKSVAVVIGHQREQIREALAGASVEFVVQEEQRGTAHAVSEFLRQKPRLKGRLLVMSGDTPLLTADLLRTLLEEHRKKKAALSLVTTEVGNPAGYGRIVRRANGRLERIVEEADASDAIKRICEINAGMYVFEIEPLRKWLPRVQPDNNQKEYYLPDVIEIALRDRRVVIPFRAPESEVLGVNTRVELARAAKVMQRRINDRWMLQGVTLHDPSAVYIDTDVILGSDTVLYPNVWLEGKTVIGEDVTVYPNCRITNSHVASGCVIYENCSVDSATLESGVKIGPFARVRPDTILRKGARIGNFVELKKTTMGEGSKANHLAYLGDATIGSDVNIGAGTITCNYDGVNKHPTIIEDDVFIGSDSQLIAPVKVGKGAYVAAGSSITEDVPAGSLAIARGRQVNKEGWVERKKASRKDAK